jgi:Exopolyphosphatase
MKRKLAVIDVGSNSVRLMLAEAENGHIRSVSKTLCTTRLAKGIDASHCLAEDRMADTVQAIDTFRKQAEALDAPVLVYATSAVRDSQNRDEFVQRVLARTGLTVRVLSGEKEGQYAFSAVTGGEGTVFDIGGGSFQIVTKERSLSFPCGCVRAKERCNADAPKPLQDALFAWMDERTDVPTSVPRPVYGVGGTISSIGALLANQTEYDPGALVPITLHALDRLIDALSAIPESERMRHPLLKERGDVILQGATILKYMMLRTGTQTVIPSDRDGMEGIAEAALKEHWNRNE